MPRSLRQTAGSLTTVRPVPSRSFYLPYLLIIGSLGFLALGESLRDALPYIVLFGIFLTQFMRPSVLGWLASIAGWFVVCFLAPLYARIVDNIAGFTNVVLFVWGVAPLLILILLRPKVPRSISR
jgi:hypothetical protein